ncbi:MAG TPA: hypothetical protein VFA99_07640 [Acidobacteriaceae bacterium]|nr:hypothetical protein [Acidobacteriaceae bacterium]
MKKASRTNPFPPTDSDRHAIWQALVERDIRAFVAQNWDIIAEDFQEDGFVGHSGSANPDDWRISYPSLDSYRTAWLEQARDLNKLRLRNTDMEQFLFDATDLTRIDINGDEALAHKKFNGRTEVVDAPDLVLQWQTLYRLHRSDGRWRMTGFLGYLPNPMPGQVAMDRVSHISLPQSASQHKAAGRSIRATIPERAGRHGREGG